MSITWNEITPLGDDDFDWRIFCLGSDGYNLLVITDYDEGFISSDGGESWEEIEVFTPLSPEDAKMNSDGSMIIVANYWDGFVIISRDSGQMWEYQRPYGGADWSSVAMSDTGDVFYAADRYEGTYRSDNNGSSWSLIPQPADDYIIQMDCSNDGSYVIAIDNDGVGAYSSDYGENWTLIETTGEILPSYREYTDCAISHDGQYMIITEAYNGLYISSDYGENWTLFSLENGDPGWWWFFLCDMSGDAKNMVISLETNNGYLVYSSTDYGESWEDSTPLEAAPYKHTYSLSLSPDGNYIGLGYENGRAYLGFFGSAPEPKETYIKSIGRLVLANIKSVNGVTIENLKSIAKVSNEGDFPT